jgi:gamma-glutamyltranspeptidase/glutathione hydrolase
MMKSPYGVVSILILVLLLVSCGSSKDDLSGGVVVTAHPLATAVGGAVLADGGNAVDAAIASAFALAVVEPYSSGLGGGGFFVVHQQNENQQFTLDARETAPLAATSSMFMRDGVVDTEASQSGALAVAVPGMVKGLVDLHERAGRLSWQRLVRPAVQLAQDGFVVDDKLAKSILNHMHRFDESAQAVFTPHGQALAAGDTLRQLDLAGTLERILKDAGEDFYSGKTATGIVNAVRATGGIISLEDLANYRTVWRDPVCGEYRNHKIIGMPPPSSGGVHLIQMLHILEQFDLAASGPQSTASVHQMAEAMKFAYAERSSWLGDPDHVDVPMAWLFDRERLEGLSARIRPDTVLAWDSVGGIELSKTESRHTTHLSVLDQEGNAVAATLTINLGFGSGMIAEGTGIVLNDEMDDFSAAVGVPNAFGLVGSEANAIGPGRRPLSSMTPTIVLEDGEVSIVTGSPGGSRIITATLQSILNVIDHGMAVSQAVTAPRIHHQWLPQYLYHEAGALNQPTRDQLTEMGHVLLESTSIGSIQMIAIDSETGRPTGFSDPRGIGSAMFIPAGETGD